MDGYRDPSCEDNATVSIPPGSSDKTEDCSENSNPVLKQLEKEEKEIAAKLKLLCTPSGEESGKSLRESANILLSLSEVYLRRAKVEKGIEQKMSYIRCAVLLHAAIARFKIVKNPEKIQDAKKLCQDVTENLLESSGACGRAELLEISERIFTKVCDKRDEIREVLNTELSRVEEHDLGVTTKPFDWEKLKILETLDSVSFADIAAIISPDREEKERRYATKVREVNEDVTAFYKNIMGTVTAECLNFQPTPPCKFSIVGLGSLAREEVTLYSDFEHIILLEVGADQNENYQSILDYFRWFSVIFQVIVIGFGETIIPSVAVNSLNNVYSNDAESNWFYDNYTQHGISFDGMLPHACKIPIGRQPTKRRPHCVELIKTPQEMAKYLTQKEQIKNGYHLADVLKQTCLVYGDEGIYESFLAERDNILEKDKTENLEIYSEMILKNETEYVRHRNQMIAAERLFDIKPVLYRPFATYVSAIARLKKIAGKSTFEILDKFHKDGLFGQYTYNKLKYGFAVACEIRMKLYHKVDQQRHGTQFVEVWSMIGRETIQTAEDMINLLKFSAEKLVAGDEITEIFDGDVKLVEPDSPEIVQYLRYNGHTEEAICFGEEICQRASDRTDEFDYVLFQCYHNAAFSNRQRRFEYYRKAEALYFKLQERNLTTDIVELAMASIYYDLERYPECAAAYETYFTKYFQVEQEGYQHATYMHAFYEYYQCIERSGMSLEEQDGKLNAVLWDKKDKVECKLLKRLHLLERSLRKGMRRKDVKKEVCSISADIQKHVKELVCPRRLYEDISNIQIPMWWLKDAAETLQSASLCHRTRPIQDEHREYDIQMADSLGLLCMCRLYGNRVADKVPVSQEQRNSTLLQRLVSILWRGFIFGHDKVDGLYVLTWIIYLKYQGKLEDIFLAHREMECPDIKYAKVEEIVVHFMEKCTKEMFVKETVVSFAMLLLAKSVKKPENMPGL